MMKCEVTLCPGRGNALLQHGRFLRTLLGGGQLQIPPQGLPALH